MDEASYIGTSEAVGIDDVPCVAGKNAALGEMYRKLFRKGVCMRDGLAITATAYRPMPGQTDAWSRLHQATDGLDPEDVADLESRAKIARTQDRGAGLPRHLPPTTRASYRKLVDQHGEGPSVAVRSSATSEELPDATIAGQQEPFPNGRGEQSPLDGRSHCLASQFTDRAIHHRVDKGFDHFQVGLSIA